MRVLAIDPGCTTSAFVLYDGARVVDHGQLLNMTLLNRLKQRDFGEDYRTVIEQIEGFGMPAGRELFETCFWSGRFAQASRPFERVTRKQVKRYLCGKTNVNERAVNVALLQRFGGLPAGFNGHRLAALGVAVTWWETVEKRGAA